MSKSIPLESGLLSPLLRQDWNSLKRIHRQPQREGFRALDSTTVFQLVLPDGHHTALFAISWPLVSSCGPRGVGRRSRALYVTKATKSLRQWIARFEALSFIL
jgi:hypothetical protein